MLDVKQIEENWEIFCAFAENGTGNRCELFTKLLDTIGDRLAECPANIKSAPGTLVDSNLKCLKASNIINKKFKLEIPEESLIVVNLFRNLGMIGDLSGPLLVKAPEYKQKNGQYYDYSSIPYMKIYDRTLFLLQHFGVQLTVNEYLAILACSGNNEDYKFGDPPLSFVSYSAIRLVGYEQEKISDIQK